MKNKLREIIIARILAKVKVADVAKDLWVSRAGHLQDHEDVL